MLVAPESSPGAPWGTLDSKNIRTSEAPPVKSGDRQPEQQTLVVPQRQCLRLVVYLPVQWPLPPTRGTTACPSIVAHITKSVVHTPGAAVVRVLFTRVPRRGVLRSSDTTIRNLMRQPGLGPAGLHPSPWYT